MLPFIGSNFILELFSIILSGCNFQLIIHSISANLQGRSYSDEESDEEEEAPVEEKKTQ